MMKYKFAKRAIALALSLTLVVSLFAPMVVFANDTVVFQLATDPSVQVQPAGAIEHSVLEDSPYLHPAGNPEFELVDNPHGNGHAIRVTNSRQNHYTTDIHFTKDGFNLSSGQYTIRVRANAEAGFWISHTDSPWSVLAGADAMGEYMELTHTFTVGGLGSGNRGLRIASNSPEYTIYEIVIARGTSIPANLPEFAGVPDVVADDVDDVEEYVEDDNGYVEDDDYYVEDYDDEDYVDEDDDEPYVPYVPTVVEEPEAPAAESVVIQLTIGNETAMVNGQAMTLDAAPFTTEDWRTMVPLRFIGDALPGAEVDWVAATETAVVTLADGRVLEIVLGQELPGGMGAAISRDWRTFVPVRFVAEQMGATTDWDGDTSTVTIVFGDAPATVAPPVVQPPAGPPAAGDADSEGIFATTTEDGDEVSGAMVVLGAGDDVWPFAGADAEGARAFEPVPGQTYRVSFNVTNRGAQGWRVRWARSTNLFGDNTTGDYAVVNNYPVSTGAVATVVPALFNQDVSPSGTYTLVVDVTLDANAQADGLIGNVGLTGLYGSHEFTVNWVSVEQGGDTLAFWQR
ncbi:MAG: copper amine oxidase N-terminal domain-containing protein [Defluviitaleaceae bacterium]|nr:copper amine oxidase N-terminal domain-containing protein [Defluviitaleaceae bacterium]